LKVKGIPQLSLIFLAIAALILIDQYVTWGNWWDWSQFLHHEVFAGMLVFGAVLLVYFVNRGRKKH